jgi:DNA-binding MarR family transcriptional regulator
MGGPETGTVVQLLSDPDGRQYRLSETVERSRSFGKVFNVVFSEELARISAQLRQGASVRVLITLPSRLNWTDYRPLPQDELAKHLDLNPASVSRALADLHRNKLIERKGRGPLTTWKLSPSWGWRGNPASYHAAIREQQQAEAQAAAARRRKRPKLTAITGTLNAEASEQAEMTKLCVDTKD